LKKRNKLTIAPLDNFNIGKYTVDLEIEDNDSVGRGETKR